MLKQSSKVNSLPIIVHISLMILKIGFGSTFQITVWTGVWSFTCMNQNVCFNVKSPFWHFLTEWTSPETLANLDWCLQKWKTKLLRHLANGFRNVYCFHVLKGSIWCYIWIHSICKKMACHRYVSKCEFSFCLAHSSFLDKMDTPIA